MNITGLMEKEMLDLIAIAQSSPGAIAVNGAIVVGYKLAGSWSNDCDYCDDTTSACYYFMSFLCFTISSTIM